MKVEITYPVPIKKGESFGIVRIIFRWIFIAVMFACPAVNIWIGGKAWSIVALWAILSVWQIIFLPDMVEYNMISQTVKVFLYGGILLALIDIFLAPGWAGFVIPGACCITLIVTAVFFFIDIDTQKHNTMPMIWLVIISLVSFAIAFSGLPVMNWPMIVLGGISSALSIMGIVAFHHDLLLEFKKRFHSK